jgi:anti-sigma-K factor RskA
MRKNHEEIKDLVAAYVLGAVAREEVPLVRAHILSCDDCMAEADLLAEVAGNLALAVEDEPLPEGFADRVLEQVAGPSTTTAPVSKERRRWIFLPAFAGVALVLAIAVLSANLFQTRGELDRRDRAISALLRSENGMELRGTGASGKVVPTASGSYFVVAGLHEAPRNHTYQLWLIDEEGPTSAGTFDVTDGVALIELEHSLEGYGTVAVTVEPAGGSPGPTSDPILISS